jgi:hypothetical protein
MSLEDIPFEQLNSLDISVSYRIANALVTNGALQITGIPAFLDYRKEALDGISKCLYEDAEQETVITYLKDGSIRYSTGAITVDGQAEDMTSQCGEKASKLRNAVHNAVRLLTQALDNTVSSRRRIDENIKSEGEEDILMAPYSTYTSIVDKGSHLEHMHSYWGAISNNNSISTSSSSGSTSSSTSSIPTLGLHTDGGLFIAMTTGLYSENSKVCDESGLYIQMPTGFVSRANVPDSSLIIMVGEGGSRWFNTKLGLPLRAVPHKLEICFESTTSSSSIHNTRAWYGKMFLPPKDALINLTPTDSQNGQVTTNTITYGKFRALEVKSMSKKGIERDTELLSSVCGPYSSPSDEEITLQTEACADDEVQCWQQCYSVEDLPCGTDAVCVDTVTDQIVDGSQMCPEAEMTTACELQCVYNATEYDGYCYGTGTIMYMDGFRSWGSEDVSNCLNFLFIGWTLDSDVKVVFACIGVFFLSILSQFIALQRSKAAILSPLVSTFLFSLHITLSYLLMLIVMMYNVELFCMVCLGLTLGYLTFHTSFIASMNSHVVSASDTKDHRSMSIEADPCCAPIVVPNPIYDEAENRNSSHRNLI